MQGLERFLNWIASKQHGVVSRVQLLEAGFTSRVIELRVASGGLIPIHPGVYLVGHRAAAPLAYEAAAVLACQPDAFLSHATATRLLDLPAPGDSLIHVTVVGRTRRNLEGVQVHSIARLAGVDRTRRDGLPITSPSLTLLDLAGSVSEAEVAAALNEARVQQLVSDRELADALERHPLRTGAKALRLLMSAESGPLLTDSEAERLALKAMREHGLEPDATQYPLGPYRMDFWFEAERVAVEVDGFKFHSTPQRFVRDRRRAAFLAAQGVMVFPLTWRDTQAPGPAMARLHSTLDARRAA